MEEHGQITPKEAEAVTGKSAATVRRYFKMLAGTKYIVAEGNTNNIGYRISMNLPECVFLSGDAFKNALKAKQTQTYIFAKVLVCDAA